MEIQSCTRMMAMPVRRAPGVAASRSSARSFVRARQIRERLLASLAFVMLVLAWDATLRLDEHVSPPRMRISHAAEQNDDVRKVLLSE